MNAEEETAANVMFYHCLAVHDSNVAEEGHMECDLQGQRISPDHPYSTEGKF